jgi:hypothetical protein
MKQLIVPSGFIEHRNHNQIWWIKTEWTHFFPDRCNPFQTTAQFLLPTFTSGGRGGAYRVPLNDGSHAIVRQYRRGGFVRHFVHDLYWDRPFRPFRELIRTEQARQRGIPTVEVLAASIEQRTLGFYRGVIITREADGFVNLWEWLQRRPLASQRTAVFAAVARTIVQLSRVGIRHADLNLTNILVRTDAVIPAVQIIDFDRARTFPGPLSPLQHQRVLQRLGRSLNKLDPRSALTTPEDVAVLCRRV